MMNKKGFTLIELLIIIAIIGILSAIAIPAFLGQREAARQRLVKSVALGEETIIPKPEWWGDAKLSMTTSFRKLEQDEDYNSRINYSESQAILRYFETGRTQRPNERVVVMPVPDDPVKESTSEPDINSVVKAIIEDKDLSFEQLDVLKDNRDEIQKRVTEFRELKREASRM